MSNGVGVTVVEPPELRSRLEQAIADSRSLLELHDDWDGEGAVAYAESTWQRAADFLRDQDRQAREQFGAELPVPRILPGPDGGVDLHWRLPDFELLVNVPADASRPGTFYGDDKGKASLRGTFDVATPRLNLSPWLVGR